jgi:hypothetical protein
MGVENKGVNFRRVRILDRIRTSVKKLLEYKLLNVAAKPRIIFIMFFSSL